MTMHGLERDLTRVSLPKREMVSKEEQILGSC